MKHRVIGGKIYTFEATDHLPAASWTNLGNHTASGSMLTTTDTLNVGTPHRFYRLRELP
jgi:hypothetical protein